MDGIVRLSWLISAGLLPSGIVLPMVALGGVDNSIQGAVKDRALASWPTRLNRNNLIIS